MEPAAAAWYRRRMNQTLKRAIAAAEALPDSAQEELGRALLDMAARKRIDAELAAAEAEGGSTSHAAFMAELRNTYSR